MQDKTIKFFKEISKIPRESGNEKKISDYICNFARSRNLEYLQDKYNNVIIKKYVKNSSPIILQAHLDMVCEKEENLKFNFENDAIEVYEENGLLRAKGTTLGADNGIGVAQILNILDSDLNISIEAIFTVSEETTMIGAENIDVSSLKGREMINLDGFESDTIITESASFFDIVLETNFKFKKSNSEKVYTINLTGMLGGHSGFEINNNRGNSSIELARLLKELGNVKLIDFVSGTKFNVIPSSGKCTFSSDMEFEEINKITNKFQKQKQQEYNNLEFKITLEEPYIEEFTCTSIEDSKKFLNAVTSFRHGVFFMDKQVTTSQNLGIVNLKENVFKIGVRSSRKNEEKIILDYLKTFSVENNFTFNIISSQPGFETKEDSALIKKLVRAYEKIENKTPDLKSVHITVESGFFENKLPGLQVAIISPKILGAHTINEMVDIESVKKCDMWLLETLLNTLK